MSLLIPTHALPPLSYRVPDHLEAEIRVGTAVIAPLSGYSRFGIVVEVGGDDEGDATEYLRGAAGELSLPPGLVVLCRWISDSFAMPLASVLRAALPPGLNTSRYRVLKPTASWRSGAVAARAALKRELGSDGLKAAETEGRIALSPSLPERKSVEWALVEAGARPDLSRAPRQRQLFVCLEASESGCRTSELLSKTGAARSVLRDLVRRGAVRLERRPEPAPVFAAGGHNPAGQPPFLGEMGSVAERSGAWVWRTPTREHPDVVAALAAAVIGAGKQALILAPEVDRVEHLLRKLRRTLPAGTTVAGYHSALGRARSAVYEAARAGEVDVVVGTRAAALLTMPRLGAVCVVDEPNEAHRAAPGYEGLPLHVRDVAVRRARTEGAVALCLSPFPSLKIREPGLKMRELPPRRAARWPSVRIVDMRGSGMALSSTVLDACRDVLEAAGSAGVVANRLGYATAVSCKRCGAVRCCPRCDLPLGLHERKKLLICGRCGRGERAADSCPECGSDRLSPTGLAVERVRHELSAALETRAGLATATDSELADARLVVGTARPILSREWDAVLLPDADHFLMGGGIGAAERAFRLLYRSAEVARQLLIIQTRYPEHYALRAAVREDYPAFVAAELPRLRALGYPPFAHLASLTLEGPEDPVRRAVKLHLLPALESEVEMSGPVPVMRAGGSLAWRVLLRSRERAVVARAGARAARLLARTGGLRVQVEVDPEEV